MSDIQTTLTHLRRPKLLVRAARLGADLYKRERDLRTALGAEPPHRQTLGALLAAEDTMEAVRKSGNGAYSAEKHIRVLTALIAEARVFARLRPSIA
ncbi:MAG: DUF6477 family protein [Pseudomonadota bacterium]